MVDKNVFSVGMVKKVVGSGLDFECFRLVYLRSVDGIYVLFIE